MVVRGRAKRTHLPGRLWFARFHNQRLVSRELWRRSTLCDLCEDGDDRRREMYRETVTNFKEGFTEHMTLFICDACMEREGFLW